MPSRQGGSPAARQAANQHVSKAVSQAGRQAGRQAARQPASIFIRVSIVRTAFAASANGIFFLIRYCKIYILLLPSFYLNNLWGVGEKELCNWIRKLQKVLNKQDERNFKIRHFLKPTKHLFALCVRFSVPQKTDRQAEKQTDCQTNKQTDRQTDAWRHKHIANLPLAYS